MRRNGGGFIKMVLENVLTFWATVRFSTRTSLCRRRFFFSIWSHLNFCTLLGC